MTDHGIPAELWHPTLAAMQAVFAADPDFIAHSLRVLDFSEQLLAHEPGDRAIVVLAALLHDIGIPEARRVHGSPAGIYQEREGPPIARRILKDLPLAPAAQEHICRIIANHHSARDIDTPEFRIIWDADWLVNLPDHRKFWPPEQVADKIAQIYKTPTGKKLARALYLS